MRSEGRTSLRQLAYPLEIASHQRFFLRAGPSLDLSLGSNSIDDLIEELAIDANYGPSFRRESGKMPGLVLGESLLKLCTRRAGVV